MPTSSSRRSDGHSRSFGPRTSASGCSAAAASSAASASGSGLVSSCSSQTHSGGWGSAWSRSSPSCTAAGKLVGAGAVTGSPKAAASRSALSSRLAVSTATTRSGVTVWARIPSITAGSHRAPSWLTSSTATEADSDTIDHTNGGA